MPMTGIHVHLDTPTDCFRGFCLIQRGVCLLPGVYPIRYHPPYLALESIYGNPILPHMANGKFTQQVPFLLTRTTFDQIFKKSISNRYIT